MSAMNKRKVTKVVTTEEVEPLMDGGVRKKKVVRKLYTWEEIPEWQKDNEHIHTGYVLETSSFKECARSLFYVHNETVNIYSHLLPAIAFLVTIFFNKYVVPTYATTTLMDYIIIDIFFLGAFSCLSLSSIFHCFKSHSLAIAVFGNKLDYLGIVFLIVSSMVSILYYGFSGSPWLFGVFSFITIAFGTACAVVSLEDKFRSREWRPYRASLFVAFGLSAVLPILAGLCYYGIKETWTRIQLKWVILEGVFYIFGAFLYGIRFPEKMRPGNFDLWGHSHQIFHVLVVIAALCHLKALIGSYTLVHYRYSLV